MRSRLKTLIAGVMVAVLAALAGGMHHLVSRGERAALALAGTLLDANAQAIETALNRQLLQADGALASLPALFAGITADGDMTAAAANQLLRGLNFQAFSFRDLLILDPEGGVWASARPRLGRRGGLSDRLDLSATVSGSATLVGPVRNKLTGDWSLYLVRPIVLPDRGRLRAVAEISVPTLISLLGDSRLDPTMRVALERRTGELIASLPLDELAIGTVQPVPAAAPTGTAPAVLRSGDDARLSVSRNALFGDVVVVVSLDERRALSEWRQDRGRTVLVGAVAALLLLGLGAALLIVLSQREKLAAERARAASVLANAIEAMSDGFVMWDADDRLVTCNEQFCRHYEVSRPFLLPGTPFEEIIRKGAEAGQYPGAGDDIDAFARQICAWHQAAEGHIERILPDGRWLLITERRTADGGIVGTRTDITALKSAQAELARETERANEAAAVAQEQNRTLKERDLALLTRNALFEAALDNMSHGLLMVDGSGRVIVGNRRFSQLFGLDGTSFAPGMSTRDLYSAAKGIAALDPATLSEIGNHHRRLADQDGAGTFVCASPGGRLAVAVTQRPLKEGGWIAIYEDVTSQQEAETRVRFLAHHDDLTKLPNRVRFRAALDENLSAAARGGSAFALLYLDLDRFKDVNDTWGHPVGDGLLKEVALRLSSCIGPGDVVARLGGDEFAIIHPLGEGRTSPEELSRHVIETLGGAYLVLDRAVVVGVSVGIAISSGQDVDADTLLKNADIALYDAKAAGRGTLRVFEPALEQARRARSSLEADLRRAMADKAFTLAYQPIFNLERRRVSSFEALLRWQHPARGWVSPAEFIPLAEEAGLIDEIGAWVLERACQDTALLPEDIAVSVNLSPQQLRSDAVVDVVSGALGASALSPHRLELEITETALLADTAEIASRLGRLRALGPQIVLDDFGTGYSSLSHLRTFPLSKIKIDQSFVREMASTRESAAIVTSVVELATRLGMRSTAEGVETRDLLDRVREAGCTEAQGFLLGRPRSLLHAFEAIRAGMTEHETATIHRLSA